MCVCACVWVCLCVSLKCLNHNLTFILRIFRRHTHKEKALRGGGGGGGGGVNNSSTWRCVDTAAGIRAHFCIFIVYLLFTASQPFLNISVTYML